MKYTLRPNTFEDLQQHLSHHAQPVMLLEGSRSVHPEDADKLKQLGRFLAREFPRAIFRSGNADGSDTLFARGVEAVDPARMQIVTPHAGHRKKNIHPENYIFPLSESSAINERDLEKYSNEASPKNRTLIENRHHIPRLKAKANYLLRDTLKVIGDQEKGLAPASAGLFYTQPDPMEGGTGHTIRVCLHQKVPVFLQAQWMGWLRDQHD
ncbi:hypothetical protein P0Y35_09700 [Kiritimatiellaeota bacterium B1221]|nr:hypothetical protein [Kiritimatiellaeota bacterium B1221]